MSSSYLLAVIYNGKVKSFKDCFFQEECVYSTAHHCEMGVSGSMNGTIYFG